MASQREREEIYGDELIRALRSDRDMRVDLLAKACRKITGAGELGPMLRSLSSREATSLLERGGSARIAALSEHPDGRVRERAAEALRRGGMESLPPLLRRVNDWVLPVANAALAGVVERIGRASDADLRTMAPMIFVLSRSQRGRSAEAVSAFLREVARHPHLARRLRHHASGDAARWLYSALKGVDETDEDVLRQALGSGDPGIVGWAAACAAKHPNLSPLFFSSRSARLRRLALDFAPPEFVEAALIDPSAGVRNDARYLAEKRYFPEYYPVRLPALGAISGLGETGTSNQAESLRPLLNDPRTDIRRRAVESFARLKGDDAEPELRLALRDPSRKVQRAAAKGIVESRIALEPAEFLDANLAPSVCWQLLRRCSRWTALIAVLRRAEGLPWSAAWLDAWVKGRGSFGVPPKPQELSDAEAALGTTEATLEPATVVVLRELIRIWRLQLERPLA